MATIPPASTTMPGVSTAQEEAASLVNSFRVTAVAERLATHIEPGGQAQSSEFFSLCLSLARHFSYIIYLHFYFAEEAVALLFIAFFLFIFLAFFWKISAFAILK